MGTGYTRNDASNNIANGNVIDAADLDGEFDAIESAFGTGGHSHDGTSAEGGAITNLGPSQEFRGDGSSLYPKADATYDLGKSTASFNVAYVESLNLGGTGLTASATEINYTDGVTSAIQTQLDGKQAADANIVSDANYVATDQNFTDADHAKLNGIATSATNTAAPAISSNGSTPSLASGITAAEVRSLIGAGTSSSDNATHTGEVTGSGALTVASNVIDADNLKVTGNGTTSQFLRSDGDGTFTWATPSDTNTVYTHPTHPGDDFSIDTGVMSGATVISDLDINITTDTNGHVTDANAAVSTRNITLANLGYTGATDANNYSHPTFNGDDFGIDTGVMSGATVISDLDINITTDTNGHVTDANATVGTRNLTLANLGYTGATDANNYVHPTGAGNKHIPTGGATDQILTYSSSGTAVWADPAGGGGAPTIVIASPTTTISSSQTWTKPGSIGDDDWVTFYLVGGGGGGKKGSTVHANASGGAGGAGVILSVKGSDIPATVVMTIGAGGSSNGGAGGDTSMVVTEGTLTAPGGAGGSGSSAVTGPDGYYGLETVGGFSGAITGTKSNGGDGAAIATSTLGAHASIYGGGGGAGYWNDGTNYRNQQTFGGNSEYAGNGSGASNSTGTNGSVPGGGSGGGPTTPGSGGAGNIRIYY